MLNRVLPQVKQKAANRDNILSREEIDGILTPEENSRFQLAYTTPHFGWQAASHLKDRSLSGFPAVPSNRLIWVYRAALAIRYPGKFQGQLEMDAVKEAFTLFTSKKLETTRRIIEAAMITHEKSPYDLGLRMGVTPLALEAYDALFFNVQDRRKDFMFLREIVYPLTRLEEYLQEYATYGALSTQLLRIGYNNSSVDNVLFFAGFRTDIMKEFNEQQAQTVFKRAVMLQGMLLAENGFLNFTKQHPSLTGARAMVQSSLIGGSSQMGDAEDGTFSPDAPNWLEAARDENTRTIKAKAGIG